MKLSSLANVMPLDINGTLSPSGAETVAIILSIGIVIALMCLVIGKFWFMPYLDYRQKKLGRQNNIKPTRPKIQKTKCALKM